jgi:hypothetical protein
MIAHETSGETLSQKMASGPRVSAPNIKKRQFRTRSSFASMTIGNFKTALLQLYQRGSR